MDAPRAERMTDPAQDRLSDVFEQALQLPPERRAAYLDEACADDAALRHEVEALLTAHDQASAWFGAAEEPVVGPAGATIEDTAEEDLVGSSISHYTLLECAGAGRMGTVYKARDRRLGRLVALKLLRPGAGVDAALLQRQLREARAASSLDHPNIGVVHDVGETDAGDPYIVMDWIDGETLQDRLRAGPLPVSDAVAIARQLASALQAAHDAGIVHRDVKPANVMLGPKRTVRLLDFGIARMIGGEPTEPGVTPGTVAYMSPEQTRDEMVDPRSDIWSLGVLLYEMLAGVRPFRGENEDAVIHAIRNDDPADIVTLRADVTPGLATAIEGCLNRSPDDRWARAAELLQVLQAEAEAEAEAGAGAGAEAGGEAGAGAGGGDGSDGAEPVDEALTAALRVRAARGSRAGRRRGVHAVAVVVVVAAVAASAHVMRGARTYERAASVSTASEIVPEERARIDPRRVVVATFENRTGSAELDVVGLMAADWITQGLSQTDLVDVVPVTAALAATRYVDGLEYVGIDRMRLVTQETRAGIIVAGAYHRQADSLYLRATVADGVSGTVLDDLEPVAASVSEPLAGVVELRRRVMSALAARLDPRMRDHEVLIAATPSFDAYRAYVEGHQTFLSRDWRGAIDRFAEAAALDSTFALPTFYAGIAYNSLGNIAAVDSIIELLRPHADRYGDVVRLGIDVLDAWVRGDFATSYQIHLHAAALVPNTLGHSTLAFEALRVNRPRKAIAVARELDPYRGELRGWSLYWKYLTEAHHRLGEHEDELVAVRRARELFPVERDVLIMEVEALAALGRVAELKDLLERALPTDTHPAGLLRTAALELRVHGYRDAADDLLRQSLARDLARPGIGPGYPYSLARTYILLGDLAAADVLLHALAEQWPDDVTVQGALGTVAARRGDSDTARRIDEWLAAVEQPYSRGRHTLWRARIAAVLGDNTEAIELLRRAWTEGAYVWAPAHTEPDLYRLQADVRFREFIRPRG
jgi:tetratricopeptide (TPR) repeat protein